MNVALDLPPRVREASRETGRETRSNALGPATGPRRDSVLRADRGPGDPLRLGQAARSARTMMLAMLLGTALFTALGAAASLLPIRASWQDAAARRTIVLAAGSDPTEALVTLASLPGGEGVRLHRLSPPGTEEPASPAILSAPPGSLSDAAIETALPGSRIEAAPDFVAEAARISGLLALGLGAAGLVAGLALVLAARLGARFVVAAAAEALLLARDLGLSGFRAARMVANAVLGPVAVGVVLGAVTGFLLLRGVEAVEPWRFGVFGLATVLVVAWVSAMQTAGSALRRLG